MYEGVPDRRKALLCGIVGGLVGAYAAQRYILSVLPRLFPDADDPPKPERQPDLLETRAPFGKRYRADESAYDAGARVAYTYVVGREPEQRLGDWARWLSGLLLGITYGATRTSTLPRDIAGGFFYGIRIWLGDEIFFPLLGLRAGPTRFTLRQHFALLTSYWVYSFVTANVTRIIYRLFAPP
jgi:hypothetical protein